MKGSLGKRLLVAAWGIPLLVALVWLGGAAFEIMLLIIALGAQLEYYSLQLARGRRPMRGLGAVCGALVLGLWGHESALLPWALPLIFLCFAGFGVPLRRTHDDAVAGFAGVAYIPLLLGGLIQVRQWSAEAFPDGGRWLVLVLLAALWVGDTAAYAAGRRFGRRKLSPMTSPNKTVEGAVAGVLSAFAVGWGAFAAGLMPAGAAVTIGFAAGVVGQVGDLMESKVKREAGVKDSGALLPGHGGMLDRFDSLIAASPVVAVYVLLTDKFLH